MFMETIILVTLIFGVVAFVFGMGQVIGMGYDVGFLDVPVLIGGITATVASLIWFWGYLYGLPDAEETDDNQE